MIDIFQETVQNTLNAMATGLKYPVMVLLILLAAVTLFLLGTLIVEVFQEHRHLKAKMPELIEQIRKAGKGNVEGCIEKSQLLKRQKTALIEITRHPDISDMMRESLAVRLITEEQAFYDTRTKRTDLIAKIGPMLGLMGTLIPLGPGVIALGQGDTYTLSTSLLIAFDTTIAGLACAAIALCISTIRKRWYTNYMSMLETLMECILDEENEGDRSTEAILRNLQRSLEAQSPQQLKAAAKPGPVEQQAATATQAAQHTQTTSKPKRQLTEAERAAIIKALREQQLRNQAAQPPAPQAATSSATPQPAAPSATPGGDVK